MEVLLKNKSKAPGLKPDFGFFFNFTDQIFLLLKNY